MKLARRSSRQTLVVALASVVALTAVACGGDDDSDDAATTGPSGSEELSGTVVFWDQLYGAQEPWKAVMDEVDAEFEAAHPGVTIEHIAQPSDIVQFAQLFQSAAQARSGPDVVMMQPSWSQTLAFHEALLPLDDYLDDAYRSTLAGWDGAQLDGVTYGIPFSLQGQVIAFNKELFTQAGLDPEAPPQSMDELIAACEKLEAAGITPFSGGNKEGYLGDWAFSTIWPGVSEPGDGAALSVGEKKFTDPTVKAGVEQWLRLIEGGFYNDDMPSTSLAPDGILPFEEGEAAMTFTIYSAIAGSSDKIGVDNLGIIPVLDASNDAKVIPAGAASTWTVTNFSKNPDAAVEYAKYLSSVTVSQRLYDETGYFPNHAEADYTKATAAYPAVADLVDLLLNSGMETETVVHATWDGTTVATFGNEVQLVVLGEKSLDDALAEVERVAAERREQLTE